MKASVKKTVRRTVFSESADETHSCTHAASSVAEHFSLTQRTSLAPRKNRMVKPFFGVLHAVFRFPETLFVVYLLFIRFKSAPFPLQAAVMKSNHFHKKAAPVGSIRTGAACFMPCVLFDGGLASSPRRKYCRARRRLPRLPTVSHGCISWSSWTGLRVPAAPRSS